MGLFYEYYIRIIPIDRLMIVNISLILVLWNKWHAHSTQISNIWSIYFLQRLHISEISDTIAHLTTSSEFLSGQKSCCTNIVMNGSSRNIISHVPICLPSRECHLVPKFPVTPTHHMGNDYLACSAGTVTYSWVKTSRSIEDWVGTIFFVLPWTCLREARYFKE